MSPSFVSKVMFLHEPVYGNPTQQLSHCCVGHVHNYCSDTHSTVILIDMAGT